MRNCLYAKALILGLFFFSALVPLVAYADNEEYFGSSVFQGTNAIVDSYNMIIIAPSSYTAALDPFIEHKTNCGIETLFVSTDDVYNGMYFNVQGRDNQEMIKYFIKDALETWGITYVMFVGSYQQIPVRYCWNNDNYTDYPEVKFVSELYYADIYDDNGGFSSWDSDGDGIFGEWDGEVAEDQPINLTPDVCLGRLACVNTREVEVVVNKIIKYETYSADTSWFKRMVVAGGDTYGEFEGYEGEIYNQMAIDVMDDFTPTKLWASTGKLNTGWDIVEAVTKGCGFLYLSGHGSSRIWATYAPDQSSAGKFSRFYMVFLSNGYKLPVCLVGGCHNSEFTISPTGISKVVPFMSWWRECWSWQLVSTPSDGAIATIGSTGLCWYGVEYGGGGTNWLNVRFFEEYTNDTMMLGQIWKHTLTHFVDTFPINWNTPSGGVSSLDAKTAQEWTLLGDPSLKIGGYPLKNLRI